MRSVLVCGVISISLSACNSTSEKFAAEQERSRREEDRREIDETLRKERERREADRVEAEREKRAADIDALLNGAKQGQAQLGGVGGIGVPNPKKPLTGTPTSCVDSGTVTTVKFIGGKVKACVDTDFDDAPDVCATWERASAKLLQIEPVFDVEDDPNAATTAALADFDPDADDPRVQEIDGVIEACPEDRACFRFMPKVDDESTIDNIRGDAKHRAVAVMISDTDQKNPHVEVWSMASGRMTARTKLTGMDPDLVYDFSVKSFGDSFLAIMSTDGLAAITVLGLEGGKRGMLAGGSKKLDPDSLKLVAPNRLVVVEPTDDDTPHKVIVVDLGGGGQVATYKVPLIDTLDVVRIDTNGFGIAQFGDQMRLDLLGLRGTSQKTYLAPGC